MKSLVEYINEELDDNLLWMLDKWFDMNDEQLGDFIGICTQCRRDRIPSNENIEHYLKGTKLGEQLKQFVDFVYNDIKPHETRNDIDILRTIVKQVMTNKTNNKYIRYNKLGDA